MASLFRPTYTLPLPTNPEIVTRQHRGKPRSCVRLMEDGKPAFYPLTAKGDRYRVPAAKWYGQYADADGALQRVPLSENKTVAQQMLNDLVRKAELGKVGIVDPFEQHHRRPLAEHLNDWEADLKAKGNGAEHVALTLARARRVVDGCGFAFICDLSASAVQGLLARLRKEEKRSVQTSNHYLRAVKQFAHWLVKDRRTGDNPIAHLAGGNVKVDRRHDHRNMTPDELAKVLTAARASGKAVHGLSGEDRFHLYLTARGTGFRAAELASLTPESFDLGDAPCDVAGTPSSIVGGMNILATWPGLPGR